LGDCYLANLHLRTANRILMRIQSFEATHFGQLEKKMTRIPWELYLMPASRFKINTSSKKCRLIHTQAIAERARSAISDRLAQFSATHIAQDGCGAQQQIFVRGAKDRFTVSIDSSGQHLYKRGLKTHPGRAPLRETVAAAILQVVGYRGVEPLMDPMCGSGTFSLEAAMVAKHIPPGWYRRFAFYDWPSFQPQRWKYLKRSARDQFIDFEAPLILASDTDRKACRQLQSCLQACGFQDAVHVEQRNFFDISPPLTSGAPGVVLLNPPYGIRLETPTAESNLFREICRKLLADYKGWRVALIAPRNQSMQGVKLPLCPHPFRHGGLAVNCWIGRVP
jgi:putative N6-adenine-specific DNA methylase